MSLWSRNSDYWTVDAVPRAGAGSPFPVAVLHSVLSNARATDAARELATMMGLSVTLTLHKGGTGPLWSRKNPTLVHHGLAKAARWHVVTADGSQPVADLYDLAGPEAAAAVGQFLADRLGRRLMVLSNFGTPRNLAKHSALRTRTGSVTFDPPRANPIGEPAKGETYVGPNGTVRVDSVTPTRVRVLELSTGNRVWLDRAELAAAYRTPSGLMRRPKLNPKGRRGPSRNPGRAPAVGSYWQRREYPQHLARVVSVDRTGGEAVANLDIVTGRGAVMGRTRVGVAMLANLYEPLAPSSPYRKTLPNPGMKCACGVFREGLPGAGVWSLGNGYDGFHSASRCWLPDNDGTEGGTLVPLFGKRKATRRAPAWIKSAKDGDAAVGNPTFRVSGTLRARLARPGRPARARLPRGLAVAAQARLLPPASRAARAPRSARAPRGKAFQPGERVTVPYMGRGSYFGRRVKKTRERATVQGMTESAGGGPAVLVAIQRGRSIETHEVPAGSVRRSPRRDYRATPKRHADKLAAMGARYSGDVDAMARDLQAAEADYERLYDVLRDTRPQGRQAPTREYSRAQRQFAEARRRGDLLQALIHQHAPDASRWDGEAFMQAASSGARINTRRNPGKRDELRKAADVFEMWHEFPPEKVTPMRIPSRTIPKHLVALGEVLRIDYKSNKWEGKPVAYTHATKRPRPVLATDPDARQLYLVGGKMRPTADGLVN